MGKRKYPHLFLLFVPASFTQFLQALDVAINGVLRSLITAACTKWLGKQLAIELTESGVGYVLDLSLKALKKPFCNFLSNAMDVPKGKTKNLMWGWIESGLSEAWGKQAAGGGWRFVWGCQHQDHCRRRIFFFISARRIHKVPDSAHPRPLYLRTSRHCLASANLASDAAAAAAVSCH